MPKDIKTLHVLKYKLANMPESHFSFLSSTLKGISSHSEFVSLLFICFSPLQSAVVLYSSVFLLSFLAKLCSSPVAAHLQRGLIGRIRWIGVVDSRGAGEETDSTQPEDRTTAGGKASMKTKISRIFKACSMLHRLPAWCVTSTRSGSPTQPMMPQKSNRKAFGCISVM